MKYAVLREGYGGWLTLHSKDEYSSREEAEEVAKTIKEQGRHAQVMEFEDESSSVLDEVITVQEASKILGVTVRQVQRLCKSGTLTARYADGIWLILKSNVKAPTE